MNTTHFDLHQHFVSNDPEEMDPEDFNEAEEPPYEYDGWEAGEGDDYDPMREYGTSYEKYGGYNGYSDDVIDDAFEGDPMNTWNVD